MKTMSRNWILALVVSGCVGRAWAQAPTATATDGWGEDPFVTRKLPAFPGAEGFGSRALGGRGGDVYEVTTLADAGPGSLREGIKKGNRTIVFRVGGTIDLQSRLDVKVSNLTIAGQTAPGGGIALKGYFLNIGGQDIVIRFLRSRLGDVSKQETDAITLAHGARNVILDHCSATWSVDEALSLSGNNQYITIQWCLIGESLKKSVHAKGEHGYGSLSRANGPVTWHHNLWVHNDARNPRLGDNYGKGSSPFFDVRNNVIYDFGDTCSGLTQGKFNVNYICNYIRPGPSSNVKHGPIRIGGPSDLRFYLAGNVVEGHDAWTSDNTTLFDRTEIEGKRQVSTADKPFEAAFVRTTSAKQAYEDVVAGVGAILPARDPVDTRIISHVRDHNGGMINSPSEVGGWPLLDIGTAPTDTDHDGMPDAWETAHGLNPNDPADRNLDPDKDGYTNLEEYLNSTDPKVHVDYTDVKNNVSTLPGTPTSGQ